MTEEAATATSQISAVLHPTDLTSSSELAFAHALRLAASGRTKLYLLHADPSAEDTDWSAYPAVRRTLASWGMLDESSLPSVVFDQLGVQVAKVRILPRDGQAAFYFSHAGARNCLTKMRSRQVDSGLQCPQSTQLRPLIVPWSTPVLAASVRYLYSA